MKNSSKLTTIAKKQYDLLSKEEIEQELKKYRESGYKWNLINSNKKSLVIYSPLFKKFIGLNSKENPESNLKTLIFGDKIQIEYLKIQDLNCLLNGKNHCREFFDSSYIDLNIYLENIRDYKNFEEYLARNN